MKEALAECLSLVRVLPAETVELRDAGGRVLAAPVIATRDQPPFAASAMDGYALRSADVSPGAQLRVVGAAPAGHASDRVVSAREALRIFTGAPLPTGADRVVMQEDVQVSGETIILGDRVEGGPHIRPAGADFRAGACLSAPRRLGVADVALAAAMNAAHLQVTRKPEVALIATGDELVSPGGSPRADQIVASNTYGLKAMIEAEGGIARLLPIARDTRESLVSVFDLARGADIIVTVGGASVGDHDLVGAVARDLGLSQSFYKIAMRPGKPLMAGRLGDAALLGLPGNPVSSLVCAHLFLVPMLRAALGLEASERRRRRARVTQDLAANGPRAHYMRAEVAPGDDLPQITPFGSQDSSLLGIMSQSNALLVREIEAPPAQMGDVVEYLPLGPIRG